MSTFSTYKALIVDDEKPVRIAIEKLADWKKYHIESVSMASNGREAYEQMTKESPDIIFMDICMPIMDGLEFLETAKEEYPGSQFIIVSGYDDFSYAQKALRFGATDYLLKPVEGSTINLAIEHALEKIEATRKDQQLLDKSLQDSSQSVTGTATDTFDSNKSPESVASIAAEIKAYIDSNFSENIRITMFSEKYYFSKEYLSRLFKQSYGFSIYEYVLKVRMENAARLLRDENTTIQDVGSKVGFSDNNYFSKAFKNYYNISPTEYRRQNL